MPDPVVEAKRMLLQQQQRAGRGAGTPGAMHAQGGSHTGRAHDRHHGFGSATNYRARGHDAYSGPARTRSPTTQRGRRMAKEGSHHAKKWEGYDPDHPACVAHARAARPLSLWFSAAAGVKPPPAAAAAALDTSLPASAAWSVC